MKMMKIKMMMKKIKLHRIIIFPVLAMICNVALLFISDLFLCQIY